MNDCIRRLMEINQKRDSSSWTSRMEKIYVMNEWVHQAFNVDLLWVKFTMDFAIIITVGFYP